MSYSRFFLGLAISLGVAGALAAAVHFYGDLAYAVPLTVGTLVLMALLSVAIFWLGKRTVGAENKFLFGNVFLGATIVKMFVCGGLIAAYILLGKPPGKLFVIPFFTTYFTFTLFEIIFLVRLAGAGKDQPIPKANS